MKLTEVANTPAHLLPKIGNKTEKFESSFQFNGRLEGLYGRPKKVASDDGKTYFSKESKIVAVWDKVASKGIIYLKDE
jgi:hypothetical protein